MTAVHSVADEVDCRSSKNVYKEMKTDEERRRVRDKRINKHVAQTFFIAEL
jgi:hypothetical protein